MLELRFLIVDLGGVQFFLKIVPLNIYESKIRNLSHNSILYFH